MLFTWNGEHISFLVTTYHSHEFSGMQLKFESQQYLYENKLHELEQFFTLCYKSKPQNLKKIYDHPCDHCSSGVRYNTTIFTNVRCTAMCDRLE